MKLLAFVFSFLLPVLAMASSTQVSVGDELHYVVTGSTRFDSATLKITDVKINQTSFVMTYNQTSYLNGVEVPEIGGTDSDEVDHVVTCSKPTSVTVPAGTFDTCREGGDILIPGTPMVKIYWGNVPGGIVKYVINRTEFLFSSHTPAN